jgi:quinol monooxygenase YgiN
MTVTSLLDLRFSPEHLTDGPTYLEQVLSDTRAFEGNLGVQVVNDVNDPAHVIAIEHWISIAHDDAYRAWRSGAGSSGLDEYLDGPAVLTRFEDVLDL